MITAEPNGILEGGTDRFERTGFKVYEITKPLDYSLALGRRDFYKIVLVMGDMTIGYGEQKIDINGTFLFFVNPNLPHSVVDHAREAKGYACLFTHTFIADRERTALLQISPLFRLDGIPAIPLNDEQATLMTGIFQKMLAAYHTDYAYKNPLMGSCLELIIHEALRIQPLHKAPKQKNAAARITRLFTELLEKQFPIESPAYPLKLRTAQDFAESLCVHVNYLNRSIKGVTGKPTSAHIAERIAAEAKALLKYTDWSVAEIAYSLGFDYPSYFHKYFKQVAGTTPQSFRKK
ncbi:helix-turn-helix domain-containing protein [Olivibacter domesticus]|uniref:Transcriptional regulator, AraC family n=1 Tax=Olivibacter domesticus TaxID=407022 RepID=A0A1H7GU87_OLID1|nr:helix-turn-helix domain-containing protein [Olivibacter domesticus]SEK40200.1 transcriptional regulator, AraC family [Olivibacter domesticus]